jgi:hypothetical protein
MARDEIADEAPEPLIQDDLAAMATILLAIPPPRIALFKAIIESYDNLATLRTEDPRRHHLRLYVGHKSRDTLVALIDSLTADFSIIRLSD